MSDKKGRIVNKSALINNSSFVKEQYEGLLVCADEQQGCYNIGIQLNDNEVMIVDQAKETNVRERIQNWAAQVQDVQSKYGRHDRLDSLQD